MFLPYYFKFKPCSLIFLVCVSLIPEWKHSLAESPHCPSSVWGSDPSAPGASMALATLTTDQCFPPAPCPLTVSRQLQIYTTVILLAYIIQFCFLFWFCFFQLLSLFLKSEIDFFFFFPCSMTLRLWEGFGSGTLSITNTKVFIKLDGEFWPWKGET